MAIHRDRSSRRIKDIILDIDDDPLVNAYQRSLDLLGLQASIRDELGLPLAEHLYVARQGQGTLLVFTDGPVWAAKLRFLTAKILAAANARSAVRLETLRIRVNPSLKTRTVPGREKRLSLSPATVQLLKSAAEGIEDAELRASLLQLALND